MTKEEAIEILKENFCSMCAYGSQSMMSCDIRGCDNRDAIKALEQEPCEDAISRQAVFNGLASIAKAKAKSDAQKALMGRVMFFTEQLPPVTPESKTGQWIQTNEIFINQDGQFIYKFICSECKSLSYFRKSSKKAIGANVCPNCGAKMIE